MGFLTEQNKTTQPQNIANRNFSSVSRFTNFFCIPTNLIIPVGEEKRKEKRWNQSKANSSFPKTGALCDDTVAHLHVITANSKINEQI